MRNAPGGGSTATGALALALKELAGQLSYEPQAGLTIATDGELQPAGHREEALLALRDHVYARYFCRWSPVAALRTRYSDRASGDPAFVAALLLASHRATCWEPGWKVVKAEGGWAFVSNGRLNLFIGDRGGLQPADAVVGAPVRVRMPCVRENLSPGFFYLVGRAGPIDRGAACLKLYLNLAPAGAAPLIEALSRGPRLEKLRFEAKVANAPGAYCRVDTALVYVEPESYPGLVSFLRAQRRAHPSWWRDETPLFTRALGPGLAVAELAPGHTRESFGQQRCRLMAEEVLRALEIGESSAERWLSFVAARFGREGIELDAPGRATSRRRTKGANRATRATTLGDLPR
ncbi:MAG: T3SS effector HopA1 family protein [Myxococcaceae bacterium]